jgi:hypothetical protein
MEDILACCNVIVILWVVVGVVQKEKACVVVVVMVVIVNIRDAHNIIIRSTRACIAMTQNGSRWAGGATDFRGVILMFTCANGYQQVCMC